MERDGQVRDPPEVVRFFLLDAHFQDLAFSRSIN